MDREKQTLRRALSIVTALVLVVSVLSIAPITVGAQQQQPTQETEPNDSPLGGTPVTSKTVSGAFDPAGLDDDWYLITVEEGETIEATANFEISDKNAEFDMTILAPNGSTIAHSYETGGQIGVAAVAPETGTYYIGIEVGFLNSIDPYSTIPYTLTVSHTMETVPPSYTGTPDLSGQPQSEVEPNNARIGGTDIQDGVVNGVLSPNGDDDWFAIRAEKSQRIEAVVKYKSASENANFGIEIVGPDGTSITSNFGSGALRQEVAAIAPQSGTYYIHLSASDTSKEVAYTLTVFSAGGQSTTTTATPTQTSNPSSETSSQSTTTDGSSTATTSNTSVDYPPGYSASGITNVTRAIENHFSTLFSYESFTYTNQEPFFFGGRLKRVSKINITNRTGFAVIKAQVPGVEGYARKQYWVNGTYYAVFDSFNDTVGYQGYNQSFRDYFADAAGRTPSGVTVIPKLLKNAQFGSAERVTTNNKVFFRYESTQPLNKTNLLPVLVENATVNSFNATIVVDKAGVIQSASYTITYTEVDGEQVTTKYVAKITAINSTTVKAPPWLPEAKTSLSTTKNSTILGIEGSVEKAAQLGAITPNATAGSTTSNMVSAKKTTTPPMPPTVTMIPKDSKNASNGNASNASTGGNSSGGSSMFGPGFGPIIAVIALLAIALLAVRRQ